VPRAHRAGRRVLLAVHRDDGDDGDDGCGRHGLAHGDRQLLALGHPGRHGISRPRFKRAEAFGGSAAPALPTRRAVDAMRRRPRRSRVCGVRTAGSGTAARGVDGGACVPGSRRADALTARRVQPDVTAVGCLVNFQTNTAFSHGGQNRATDHARDTLYTYITAERMTLTGGTKTNARASALETVTPPSSSPWSRPSEASSAPQSRRRCRTASSSAPSPCSP